MNTTALKLDLLDKLASVTDEKLLNEIMLLLKDVDVNVTPYKLNKEQLNMVKESEADIIAGKLHTNQSVFKEDEEWLKNL